MRVKYITSTLIVIIFIFSTGESADIVTKKKKLYISTIRASGVAGSVADRVKEGIKLSIFENYGSDYQILDDEAIKVMYVQASRILSSGCSDTSCVEQIAEGINADEIIYGAVSSIDGKIKIDISNMIRRKTTLDVKSLVSLIFSETNIDHYSREAGRKLLDKGYAVKHPVVDTEGKVSLKTIEMERIGGIKGITGIDELGISVMKFTTTDEIAGRILDYLKGLVTEGDAFFRDKKYDDAVEKYSLVIDRVRNKLREESRTRISGFVVEVEKRTGAAYGMKYKISVDEVDAIMAAGEWKSARKKFNAVIKDVNKNVPPDYSKYVDDIKAGLKQRIGATWVIEIKNKIEKVDGKLKEKEGADESSLSGFLKDYKEIEDDIKEVPEEVNRSVFIDIKSALGDRHDTVLGLIIGLWHRKADAAYREYRFHDALKIYRESLARSAEIRKDGKRVELEKHCNEKINATLMTGKNYMLNSIKSFTDKAEYFNVQDKISEAKTMMKEARKLLTGPLMIFTKLEVIDDYNKMALGMGMDQITEESEPELFAPQIVEKKRIQVAEEKKKAERAEIEARKLAKDERKRIEKTEEEARRKESIKIGDVEFINIPSGKVTAFLMGKYEVTQRQYEKVMGVNPSLFEGKPNNPVEQVSWYNAVEFCNKMSIKTGLAPYYNIDKLIKDPKNENGDENTISMSIDKIKWTVTINKGANGFRLPTSEEWEYAARAGTTSNFFWGDSYNFSTVDQYAVFDENSSKKGYNSSEYGTHKAGSKKPNPWGLYDMAGNVLEWCFDWYENSGSSRVARGGSWNHDTGILKSGNVGGFTPSYKYDYRGFRLVKDL